MARGFESKMVEFQQEEAARRRSPAPPLSEEDKARQIRQDGLVLARARAAAELARAKAPAHRRMLEQALAAIDQEIAKLDR